MGDRWWTVGVEGWRKVWVGTRTESGVGRWTDRRAA